jgi:hypothetical protein
VEKYGISIYKFDEIVGFSSHEWPDDFVNDFL